MRTIRNWLRNMGLAALAVSLGGHALPLDIKPTSKELRAERQWLKEHLLDCKFEATEAKVIETKPASPQPGLDVLANNDPVIPNGRGDKPLKIGDKEYSRGLFAHAVSKVEVRLPGPGREFTATVGLDHNDDTARGKGSVVFIVRVNGKTAFQSEVMRYGTAGREVKVDLGGANSFWLEVERRGRRHRLGPMRLGGRKGGVSRRAGAVAGRYAVAR